MKCLKYILVTTALILAIQNSQAREELFPEGPGEKQDRYPRLHRIVLQQQFLPDSAFAGLSIPNWNPEDETDEAHSRRRDFKFASFKRPEIMKQTIRIALVLGVSLGGLYMLPESVTNWDKSTFFDKYTDNITAGPRFDEDDWFLNYIGHPYVGAVYYRMAMDAGLSPRESFAYSAFVSTVMWEYGIEALAERPSIQDLVVTPVFGSILGELFIRWENGIKKRGGRILGSRIMGKIAIGFMNPADALFGPPTSGRSRSFSPSMETHIPGSRPKPAGPRTHWLMFSPGGGTDARRVSGGNDDIFPLVTFEIPY